MKKINQSTLFLLLVFIISYGLAGFLYLQDIRVGTSRIWGMLYMFIPAICAVLIRKIIYRKPLDLLISFKINRWFFIAWLTPLFVSLGSIGIALLFPNVNYSPEMQGLLDSYASLLSAEDLQKMKESLVALPVHPVLLTALQGLLAGITINAIAGFGEELGWRGFLVTSFQHMKFWKAVLWIGFIWGIWHAPLILMGHNYPQHPVWGVFMMIVWCILLTPLFIYMTLKSKSVIAAAIMHGTLNGTAGIGLMMTVGGNDLTIGVTGLAGFISLILFTIGFFFYDTRISKEKIMLGKLADYL